MKIDLSSISVVGDELKRPQSGIATAKGGIFVSKVAAQAAIPPVRLALAWVLSQPAVTGAVMGASRAPSS